MLRKAHRKSRSGCSECKRRHIKCDETRPKCMNCVTTRRSCAYAENFRSFVTRPRNSTATASSVGLSNTSAYSRDVLTESPLPTSCQLPQSPPPQQQQQKQQQDEESQSLLNMDHLELFHHFLTEIPQHFGHSRILMEGSESLLVRAALSTPYLMHQMLALSSLHLSIIKPERRTFYSDQAAQLQSRAIAMFNTAKIEVTEANCVPLLIFASMIGTHVLCEILTYRDGDDFNSFLGQFVNYLRLHRATRVVAHEAWPLIHHTEIKPILEFASSVPRTGERRGKEFNDLLDLLEAADMSASSILACREAVNDLQWVLDWIKLMGDVKLSAALPHIWCMMLSEEYIGLLVQRKPEALVILAYFGVLLHYHRQSWFFGDGGKFLIQSITQYLGSYWEKWLSWPNEVLRG